MNDYYKITKEQMSELYKLKEEYGDQIPFCKSFVEAEFIINKFKYAMKGLDVPVTRSQRKVLSILRKKHNVKIPYCTNQKMAAGIIDRYNKKYNVLNNKRLEGYHSVFVGNAKAGMTVKQYIIIDSLTARYGNKVIPVIKTRKEAWDFINKYQEIIYSNENGFYIDKENINILKIDQVKEEVILEQFSDECKKIVKDTRNHLSKKDKEIYDVIINGLDEKLVKEFSEGLINREERNNKIKKLNEKMKKQK